MLLLLKQKLLIFGNGNLNIPQPNAYQNPRNPFLHEEILYLQYWRSKVKSQCLTKHHAVKTFGRQKYSSTLQPLHPRRNTKKVPIANEAAWAPELVWTLFKRENSVAPAGN